MSLQTLPGDILLGILQHISSWSKYPEVDLKQQLVILAIFQRLRTIALPKIYKHVYINFGDEGYTIKSYANKYRKTFGTDIDTNADIIALANCTHMVKSANISVYNLSETYVELHNTIEALQYCAESWPNISKLELSMDHNDDSDISSDSQLMQPSRIGEEHCQKLANIMPGITELKLVNPRCYGSLVRVFNSHVVGTYADQLITLTNECGFDRTGRHKFKVMQHLFIQMRHNNMALPCVNIHILVSLHIEGISVNTSWAPFLNSNDDTTVVFPCLKRLLLHFRNYIATEYTDENMPEILLKFPVLSSLTVVCNADVCPFFQMAVFPDVMEYIYIKAPPALLAQLNDMETPTAKNIFLHS